MTERMITIQLRPRQAMLLNMMFTLAGACMNGEQLLALRMKRSCVNFADFIRSEDSGEVQALTNKISNIRRAFTDEDLEQSGIANHLTDPDTGGLVRERRE
jgi:DNA-binding winged helix-turn-helix (wHTH) protein